MATMNISLPDPLKLWVETQAKTGRYGNVSDYVRDVIRRDQEYQSKRDILVKALIAGENSGVSELTPKDIWQGIVGRPDPDV